MATCIGRIYQDIGFDCDNKKTGGVTQSILLVNRQDIESKTTDIDAATGKHSLTNVTLKTGTTGYLITSIDSKKQIFDVDATFNYVEDAPNDWTHSVGLRTWNLTEADMTYINSLGDGVDIVAFAKDSDGWKVYGIHSGLTMTEGKLNSKENKGNFVFRLASSGTDLEPYAPLVYLDTDEATTEANITGKLAA